MFVNTGWLSGRGLDHVVAGLPVLNPLPNAAGFLPSFGGEDRPCLSIL